MRLRLPTNINAAGLLPFISLLDQGRESRTIALDFSDLRRVSPAALVVLAARINDWRGQGRLVVEHGLSVCPILPYLQRMNLLEVCGITLPETFARHDAKGRFVPIRFIDHDIEEMGSEMALCVAPGGDEWGHPLAGLYDLAWYVLTEMGNNVRQHSGGAGYAAAQVGPSEGLVRIAIADSGRGVLASFREAGLPWSAALDDAGAILKALEPRISSKGSPTNEGVGLTLTGTLARLAEAWLLIVSGHGVVLFKPGTESSVQIEVLPDGGYYPGTLVALTFRQDRVEDFARLLDAAKRQSGLLRQPGRRGKFSE